MVEADTVFSSKVKYKGVFSFVDFYKFCYDWVTEEIGLNLSENKYEEKISGNKKNLEIEWTGEKELTDYFKFQAKIKIRVTGLENVDVTKSNVKISTNKGTIQIDVKGIVLRDYKGKFERTAFQKFSRSIYERWIITSRIDEYNDKIAEDCDEFLSQAKAYLDLEGKR